MAHDLGYALRRLAYTWFTALLVLVGLVVVFWWGPTVEPYLNPVLRDQTFNVVVEGDRVTFDVRAYKARSCRIADLDWYVSQGERATWVRVYRDDGSISGPDVTYPMGWRKMGPFHLTLPMHYRDADSIGAVLHYDCHPGWLTTQFLGPVRLP